MFFLFINIQVKYLLKNQLLKTYNQEGETNNVESELCKSSMYHPKS